MLYSNPYNIYPDLNYFSAPFCIPQCILIYPNNYNVHYITSYITSIPFNINQLYSNKYTSTTQIQLEECKESNFQILPSKPSIITLESPSSIEFKTKDLFLISSSSSSPKSTKSSHSQKTLTPPLNVLKLQLKEHKTITYKIITEFNTNPKLKKIHSTYHLKRKVTTKFQNDIKNTLNHLISSLNMINKNFKLPFVAPNSKNFREDVKIESLKTYKHLTIAKYISEDVNNAERSLNMANVALISKINDLKENEDTNCEIKQIYDLLNNTCVVDYYNEFLNSERFKKCFEKDIEKYVEKLEGIGGLSKERKDIYKIIFKEKYEGIAKSYFSCE
jgi:chaperonin GroEL (HSP60 family)